MQFLTKVFSALAVFGAAVIVAGSAMAAGKRADRIIRIPFEPVTRDNLDAYN